MIIGNPFNIRIAENNLEFLISLLIEYLGFENTSNLKEYLNSLDTAYGPITNFIYSKDRNFGILKKKAA